MEKTIDTLYSQRTLNSHVTISGNAWSTKVFESCKWNGIKTKEKVGGYNWQAWQWDQRISEPAKVFYVASVNTKSIFIYSCHNHYMIAFSLYEKETSECIAY